MSIILNYDIRLGEVAKENVMDVVCSSKLREGYLNRKYRQDRHLCVAAGSFPTNYEATFANNGFVRGRSPD